MNSRLSPNNLFTQSYLSNHFATDVSDTKNESSAPPLTSQQQLSLLLNHPQYQQPDSLSHYIFKMISQGSAFEDKQDPKEQMKAYLDDNKQFAKIAEILLNEFKELSERLLNFPAFTWIDNRNFIKEHFYPEVQSSEWIKQKYQTLCMLAKELQSAEPTILGSSKEAKLSMQMLINGSSSRKYPKLLEFLNGAYFLQRLWSDLNFLNHFSKSLNNIYLANTRDANIYQANILPDTPNKTKIFNQAVIDFFKEPLLSRNISFIVFVFIKNLKNEFFSSELIIDDPLLFHHFNQLSVNELIGVAQGLYLDHSCLDVSFLEKIIQKPEINQRLESCHYVLLASIPDNGVVLSAGAKVVLSVSEVPAKLTDNDLLTLVDALENDALFSSLKVNENLKKRMNGDLWFRLASEHILKDELILAHKEIYDLFSPQQLKQLILDKYSYHCLLSDNGVFNILFNDFTVAEIKKVMDCYQHLSSPHKQQQSSGTIPSPENPELFTKINELYKQAITNASKLSEMPSESGRGRQILPVTHISDNPGVKSTSRSSTSLLSGSSEEKEGHSAGVPATDQIQEKLASRSALMPLSQTNIERMREEKSGTSSTATKYMGAALMLACTLVVSATTLGISALFLPYLLTAAVTLLGAALLAFGVYAVINFSQYGMFSARRENDYSNQPQENTHQALLTNGT